MTVIFDALTTGAIDYPLLTPGEPPPFFTYRRHGQSSFVIAVDHASSRIPQRLGDLGLPASELQRHVAWDIGSLGVSRLVADALDAPLVAHNYSRLVIDCNRLPGVETSIPRIAESTEIPGNIGLSEPEILARRTELFDPYHSYLRALLDERQAANRPTILLAQHTMTDIFKGQRRQMHAAVIYWRDRRLAGLVLDVLRQEAGLVIGDNEPYVVDETHYTIPHHAEARGLPYAEIEVRQDLVSDVAGQVAWAHRISRALQVAERVFFREAK
jgi:predicted N-formylglutamate amidohydrolase